MLKMKSNVKLKMLKNLIKELHYGSGIKQYSQSKSGNCTPQMRLVGDVAIAVL
jgi:hypothetical protein